MEKKQYLFCPGPVMVSEKVRESLRHPDMCHRVPAFEKVIQNAQNNLLKVFKANEEYAVLLITGSGTAANETVISSYFTATDEVLLVNNGEFGCRLEELLEIHEVKTTVLNCDWGKTPSLSEMEEQLKQRPEITTIMSVYHETSTGVINPVTEMGQLAHRYGKTFIVDAVSALGGEDVDVVRDHIDFCTCSSNKCLASLPGVGIICGRKSKLEQTRDNKTRIAYLNLHRLYEISRTRHQTPNTPSVTMFIALEAALERLFDEGLDAQIERHRRCSRIIRDGVKKMGLGILVEEETASNTVTSVFLPAKIDLGTFVAKLDEKGITVYPGKRHLKEKNMFQIANMGEINDDMCHNFLEVMSETLKELSGDA